MKRLAIVSGCLSIAAAAWALGGAANGDAAKGKGVFAGHCAVCHNADSTAARMGPGLKGLFRRANCATGSP
jgi:cytochrome c2